MTTVRLSQKTLAAIGQNVSLPTYDRNQLGAGIVHIGLGNFHRSHMATYLDRLFCRGKAHEWAIIGAGVMPADVLMRHRLGQQDWLSTVVELGHGISNARVLGSMVGFAPIMPAAIIQTLLNPGIRIVTLTITEEGYFLDAATGLFDAGHPGIQADAANPQRPSSVFGIIVRALAERRARGFPPFTILSCDNLPGNGDVTKYTVVGLAERIDTRLADWIRHEVTFPNAMVDCITPRTFTREQERISHQFGVWDSAPVICEPFRQWVVEDKFCAGRPPLEDVGVELVDDVSVHETMKLRILNAGHASIAYVAALLGYQLVQAAMEDTDIQQWLLALQDREILPVLKPIEGVNYRVYQREVFKRFRNSEVRDKIARLCANGSTRQPKFVLPAIRDALRLGYPVEGMALELALWCRYCEVADGVQIAFELKDPMSARLRSGARLAAHEPRAFLGIQEIFHDLEASFQVRHAFAFWLNVIKTCGARDAIRRYTLTSQLDSLNRHLQPL